MDPNHPVLLAVRQYLAASGAALAGDASGAAFSAAAIEANRSVAGGAARGGGLGEAVERVDGVLSQVEAGLAPQLDAELSALWLALTPEPQDGDISPPTGVSFLGVEEVEELVLALLCELPRGGLPGELLQAPLRHVALGQQLLEPEDRRIDASDVRRRLAPELEQHRPTAERIAREACEHLLGRSEALAASLLRRMDVDKDGAVSREAFFRAAPNAIACEVENVVVSAGVQALMASEDFQDLFHTAVAGSMGLDEA